MTITKTRPAIIRDEIIDILKLDSYVTGLFTDTGLEGAKAAQFSDDIVIYKHPLAWKVAPKDPAISVYHTNRETYSHSRASGIVDTRALLYIDILVRKALPEDALDLAGLIADNLRIILMPNTNLNNTVTDYRFTQKELIPIEEKKNLYTLIVTLQLEVFYNPKALKYSNG